MLGGENTEIHNVNSNEIDKIFSKIRLISFFFKKSNFSMWFFF